MSQTHVVSKQAHKLTTNKTFMFWREGIRRHVHAKRASTARDRYLLSKERTQRRQEYRDALHKAHDKIYDLAWELKDRFGKHTLGARGHLPSEYIVITL
jgi:hypothetical protein